MRGQDALRRHRLEDVSRRRPARAGVVTRRAQLFVERRAVVGGGRRMRLPRHARQPAATIEERRVVRIATPIVGPAKPEARLATVLS